MGHRAMQPGDFTKTNKATSMKSVDGKLLKRPTGEKGTKIHCYMAQGSSCTPAGKVIRKKVYGQTVQESTGTQISGNYSSIDKEPFRHL